MDEKKFTSFVIFHIERIQIGRNCFLEIKARGNMFILNSTE